MTFRLNNQRFPTIDLGSYILREKQDFDVEDFYNYFSNTEVNKYIICQPVTTLEEARKELHFWRGLFYQNLGIYFAIARKDNNQMIGSIGLNNFSYNHNRIEISYDLAKEYWRQGITTHAIKAVTDFAFKYYKINRIEAFTATENLASKNLLEKCKYNLEGTLKEHRFHQGKYIDVFVFSRLARDYQN